MNKILKNQDLKTLKKIYLSYKNRYFKNKNLLLDLKNQDKNDLKYFKINYKNTSLNKNNLIKLINFYKNKINILNDNLNAIYNNKDMYIKIKWYLKIALANYIAYNETFLNDKNINIDFIIKLDYE